MKSKISAHLVISAFALILLASCTKSSSPNVLPGSKDSTAQNMQGNWVIRSYTQRTEDKTSLFAGLTFSFLAANIVTVNDQNHTTGTWSYRPTSVTYYGSTPVKASITFNLGTKLPFSRLNRIWNISDSTGNSFSLVNPEPADDEHIVFARQ